MSRSKKSKQKSTSCLFCCCGRPKTLDSEEEQPTAYQNIPQPRTSTNRAPVSPAPAEDDNKAEYRNIPAPRAPREPASREPTTPKESLTPREHYAPPIPVRE